MSSSSVLTRGRARALALQKSYKRQGQGQDKAAKAPSTDDGDSGGVRNGKRKLANGNGNVAEGVTKRRRKKLVEPNCHSVDSKAPKVEDEADRPGASTTAISPAVKMMQNNIVMSMIAKKLPANDLKTLRRTCSLWNQCFLPEWQKKQSLLRLNTVETTWQRWRETLGKERDLHAFSDLMRSSSQIPYTKYQIFDLTATRHHAFRDFFEVCDKSIRHLHLRNSWHFSDQGVNIDKLRRVLFELTPELEKLRLHIDEDWETPPVWAKRPKMRLFKEIPKLRELELTINGSMQQPFPELLKDLLHCAVGLEVLALVNGCHSNNTAILSMLRDFPTCLRNLKTLKMYLLLVEEFRGLIELARRKENPLRLEKFATSILGFSLRPEDHSETIELLQSFLVSQRTTLREFDLEIEGLVAERNLPVVRIPKMDAVNSFIFRRQGQRMITVQYEGETFANNFPSLKRFEYNFVSFTPKDLSEGDICGDDLGKVAHDGVTDLSLAASCYGLNISSLGILLPSVTTLEFGLTSGTYKVMPVVWTAWPALSILRIRHMPDSMHNTMLDLDHLLTGIPKSKFKTLTRKFERATEPFTLEGVRQLLNAYKTKPGISDLKHLREFVLDVRGTSYKITDIGAYLGLVMTSPTMQHLEIQHESKETIVEMHKQFLRTPHQKNLITFNCRDLIKNTFNPYAVVIL